MITRHLEQYLKSHLRSGKSVDAYMFDIRKFIDLNPRYKAYTYDDISEYFSSVNDRYRRADGRVTASAARIFASVKWLYSFLIHSGERDTHPFPPSYRIKGTKKKGMDTGGILTPSELSRLFDFMKNEHARYKATQQRNLAMVSLFIYQGITSTEMSNLRLSDIDLDNGTVHIGRTLNTNERILPLHPTQFMVMHTYITEGMNKLLKGTEGNGTFIVNPRGSISLTDMISRTFKKYKLLLGGKPITAENIRRSVIWNMLNVEKKHVDQVQLFAGHKWPSTTQRYVSAIDFNDRDLINKLHPIELI